MFVVLLTYTVPLATIDAHVSAHREFLARQYAAGTFLLSGRMEPREGGVILATAASRDALEAVLAQDPFRAHGLARYQVVEFAPSMAAPMLRGLIEA